jgi:hypothetical protein
MMRDRHSVFTLPENIQVIDWKQEYGMMGRREKGAGVEFSC